MAEKNEEKALDDFLDNNEEENTEDIENNKDSKKKVIDEREGLIERVDKVLVTKDGRQLLREQY